jgi:hypothetical protein
VGCYLRCGDARSDGLHCYSSVPGVFSVRLEEADIFLHGSS